ncbi:unnamed protein product [Cylicocyclus nassatus]|uniref:Uncharacterized protein n=1 Tax=Cylicocyclus nassatus TaxID=53992 RepID=A0AA36MF05_CYLNA|nr:unnamed protein product [Cylicocyclus nassatus]
MYRLTVRKRRLCGIDFRNSAISSQVIGPQDPRSFDVASITYGGSKELALTTAWDVCLSLPYGFAVRYKDRGTCTNLKPFNYYPNLPMFSGYQYRALLSKKGTVNAAVAD